MSDTGLRMTLVDGTTIATPPTGRSLLFPDEATGTFSVKLPSGLVIPWGASAPSAPVARTSAFSITDADNGKTYDLSGAYTFTLESGVTPGIRVLFIQSQAGQVQQVTAGAGASLISLLNTADPLIFSGQGSIMQAISLDGDAWYITAVGENLNLSDIPLTIPNLVTWYPFDRAATVSGLTADQAPVVDIIDQSTIGEDLNQAAGANQAVLNTNAQNGLTALRFDQIDMYPLTAGQLVLPTGNNTVFAVAWQPQEENNQYVIGMDSVSDNWGIKTNAGEFEFHNGGQIKEATRDMTTPSVIVGSREGTQLKVYNGNTNTGTSSNGSSPTVSNGALGGRGGTIQRFDGWVGEVAIYNRILSTEERETVVNYLGAKWNVTV